MKIYKIEELATFIAKLKKTGQVVGLCHGCFDILHTGHIRHFEYAASKCDRLFVSVTADRFINKGPNRPVFTAEERANMISALRFVSGTVINDNETSLEILNAVRPSIYFKGQEYYKNPEQVNSNFLLERDYALSLDIDVQFTFEETDSSTRIFNKIREGVTLN